MNYLIDTHAFLWSVFDPSRLSKTVKAVITNPEEIVYVSVVSFWEISLKYSLGKLMLKNCKPEDLISLPKKMDFEILELDPKEAARFHHLPKLGHKDPFDRMILWQALERDLTLISKDKHFEDYKKFGLTLLW